MSKRIFCLLIATFLMFFSTFVFAANNELGDSMSKAGNTVRNVVGGAENVVEDAAGNIGAGVRDLGNTFADGAARVTDNGDQIANDNMGNGDYAATRTATARTASADNGTFLGMSSNTWTWLILAIAAILIVGLVWYYVAQNRNEYNNNNH